MKKRKLSKKSLIALSVIESYKSTIGQSEENIKKSKKAKIQYCREFGSYLLVT